MTGPDAPRCLPVGVVVERRPAASPWLDVVWRPVAVLGGRPDVEPWTTLSADADATLIYAGAAEIELYRSEADHYRGNLASGAPSLWISLHPTAAEPPWTLAAVTADPAEGEAWTEPGTALVEAVPMPAPIRAAVAAFVAAYPIERPFRKRVRDDADSEMVARHARGGEQGNDRN